MRTRRDRWFARWWPQAAADQIREAFDRLRADGKRVLLLWASHEPLHDELARSGRMARLEELDGLTSE